MIAPGDRVLVALSGGPDSTALLHALWLLRERFQYELACAHVHHGLRGADADADARHAEQQAASLGLPFVVKRAAVREHARARHLSLEAAARELRYRLLEEAADALGAQRIATGHTASDLAETLLLNMLRGASVSGLTAMPPVRGRIIRPLIQLTRGETLRFCEEEGLAYRVDKSNFDPAHLRNRVRHEVMPALRGLQPRAEAALCRLARLAREEDALLAQQAEEAFRRITTRSEDELSIASQEFARLPLALRRRVAHMAIAAQAGGKADVESERVEAVAALIAQGRTGARVELPGRLEARRLRGRVVIGPARPRPAPAPGVWELSVPGFVSIPELGLQLSASYSAARLLPADPMVALMDADGVAVPLEVRTRRPGDRFAPLGMSGEVKLQDFLVNQKVPREERDRLPLVLSGNEIVWVVGHRISDRVKVTEGTRRTIRLVARAIARADQREGEECHGTTA